jgi:hypothetical protein
MVVNSKAVLIFFMMVLFFIPACTGNDGADRKPVFKQLPEMKEIKPGKPVKIKLKRGVSGNCSWEISRDNADRILKANNKLKESVEKDE